MQPITVTDLDLAFGANVKRLMPKINLNDSALERGWGGKLAESLFYNGGSVAHLVAKPGIDRNAAIRHIRAILGSWEPKHEHKMAACGYLFQEWFEQPA